MTVQALVTNAQPESTPNHSDPVKIFKALADPARLRLLELIAAAPQGEICVCDVLPEFNLSQPTISHHLKLLRQAGLITLEKRSTWSYYSIRPGAVVPVQAVLRRLEISVTRF